MGISFTILSGLPCVRNVRDRSTGHDKTRDDKKRETTREISILIRKARKLWFHRWFHFRLIFPSSCPPDRIVRRENFSCVIVFSSFSYVRFVRQGTWSYVGWIRIRKTRETFLWNQTTCFVSSFHGFYFL